VSTVLHQTRGSRASAPWSDRADAPCATMSKACVIATARAPDVPRSMPMARGVTGGAPAWWHAEACPSAMSYSGSGSAAPYLPAGFYRGRAACLAPSSEPPQAGRGAMTATLVPRPSDPRSRGEGKGEGPEQASQYATGMLPSRGLSRRLAGQFLPVFLGVPIGELHVFLGGEHTEGRAGRDAGRYVR